MENAPIKAKNESNSSLFANFLTQSGVFYNFFTRSTSCAKVSTTMKINNAIIEIAIFTVKQESINQVSEIRSRVKESLQSFKGFISINTLQPVNSSRVFADIALWETLKDAHNAAKAFEEGDERFLPYMNCIEEIKFMGHFIENNNSEENL